MLHNTSSSDIYSILSNSNSLAGSWAISRETRAVLLWLNIMLTDGKPFKMPASVLETQAVGLAWTSWVGCQLPDLTTPR